jgi:hypothetical protein
VRLRHEEIEYVAWRIVKKLEKSGEVDFFDSEEGAQEQLSHVITENLMVEDRLNREVDDILRAHQNEMQHETVDYRRMFQLIKSKLARERGLIL